jgi:N-methylhydantoinase B
MSVLKDVEMGFISPATALNSYGVVFGGDLVDEAATSKRREALQPDNETSSIFSFGPEREKYESVWSEALQDTVNHALLELPSSLRFFIRARLRERIEQRVTSGQVVTPAAVEELLNAIKADLDWHVSASGIAR